MEGSSEGTVALVVGGGTGMGYAAAKRLAGRGTKLVLSGRREAVLVEAMNKITESSPDTAVEIFAGDAGVEEQSNAMVATAIEHYGRLDVLVGAAGIYDTVPFAELDATAWRKTMTATLDAMAFPAFAAVREMKKAGRGNIILISSIDTIVAEPEAAAYNAAKAAVGGIVRSIVVDCTKDGIQANAVAPGWVYTPMAAGYLDEAESGIMDRINPLGRAADADEVGNVIEYLALDAPQFLTGSTIFIDGGQTIRAAIP